MIINLNDNGKRFSNLNVILNNREYFNLYDSD